MKKFNLQMFAEDEPDNAEQEPEEEPEDQPKMYTEEEMNSKIDEIVARKLAEADKKSKKAVEDAKAEGERLAKMDAEEKQKYEQEQAQKELEEAKARVAELEKAQTRSELSRKAAQIMKDDYEVVATQDMLDFVVGEDADATKANIEKFVAIINDDRKAQEKARATGSTPKDYGGEKKERSEIEKRIAKYKK